MITYGPERPFEDGQIDQLLDKAFGPARLMKASYRLRQDVAPVQHLSMVARDGEGRVVGTIRFWPVTVRDMLTGRESTTLYLGPLAVDPETQGSGIGSSLMKKALAKVDRLGYQRVMLVGDAAYYGRFGFVPVKPCHITLPGGADADRLLVRQRGMIAALPAVGQLVRFAPASDEAVASLEPARLRAAKASKSAKAVTPAAA